MCYKFECTCISNLISENQKASRGLWQSEGFWQSEGYGFNSPQGLRRFSEIKLDMCTFKFITHIYNNITYIPHLHDLSLIMYIFTTLEYPTYNFHFHILTTGVNTKYIYIYISTLLCKYLEVSCIHRTSINTPLVLVYIYIYFNWKESEGRGELPAPPPQPKKMLWYYGSYNLLIE